MYPRAEGTVSRSSFSTRTRKGETTDDTSLFAPAAHLPAALPPRRRRARPIRRLGGPGGPALPERHLSGDPLGERSHRVQRDRRALLTRQHPQQDDSDRPARLDLQPHLLGLALPARDLFL